MGMKLVCQIKGRTLVEDDSEQCLTEYLDQGEKIAQLFVVFAKLLG